MKRAARIALAGLAAAVLVAGGFLAGRRTSGPGAAAPVAAVSTDRKVLYWHDPMVPDQRFDKPGKSPFMDMQLVPVYAQPQGDPGGGGVVVSPAVQQNLGIRTAAVRRADIAGSVDAVGAVQFDERLSVAVQTRVSGYVEHLAVRAPMERVRQGQALATVFAPEWLAPQNEWLALKRAGVSGDLVAAARERMRALSIPDALVRRSEASGTAQARFTLDAPVGGVVVELGVREGVAVTPGTTLLRIAGLEKVWAVAEVPEAQATRLARGQKVKAMLQADPSRTFDGELAEILPQVSASTRTLQARFEVDNRGGMLVPGMLLRLQVAGPAVSGLLVPAEAVIRTGQRAVVLVRRPDGSFESRDVAIGPEVGDDIVVLQGLAEAEQVVASGQFLIDSEARLRSVTSALNAPPTAPSAAAAPAPAPSSATPAAAPASSASPPTSASASAPASASASVSAAPGLFTGEGRVESVGPDAMTISHGPVAALRWPPMTMGFGKPEAKAFADIRPGDTVRFVFRSGGATDYELVSVTRVGAAR